VDSGLDGQDGGAGSGARFQGLAGITGILERKTIGLDGTARLPNLHRMSHTDFLQQHELRNTLMRDR
jgi:hypothetical protein